MKGRWAGVECGGSGEPDGFAAASAGARSLSKEHWLSRIILESAADGKPVLVGRMPWQAGAKRWLPAKSLGTNILCERHNRPPSPLDIFAGEVFRVIRRYEAGIGEETGTGGHEFALFPGDLLERWAIKLFWGAVAAGALRRDEDTPVSALRSIVNLRWGRPPIPLAGRSGAARQPIVLSLPCSACAARRSQAVQYGPQAGLHRPS